jgi:hypothetical protein
MGHTRHPPHARPDVELPELPDALDDLDFEWPESGPSRQRSALSDATLGPKAIAAMTGALSTSLLSASPADQS